MTTVSTCARKVRSCSGSISTVFPWFVCGMFNLLGEVSKFEYALCWICVLILIWMYVPVEPVKAMHRRSSDGKNNIEKGVPGSGDQEKPGTLERVTGERWERSDLG